MRSNPVFAAERPEATVTGQFYKFLRPVRVPGHGNRGKHGNGRETARIRQNDVIGSLHKAATSKISLCAAAPQKKHAGGFT